MGLLHNVSSTGFNVHKIAVFTSCPLLWWLCDVSYLMALGRAGRYVILLMAIFSIYTGLLYNEAFSIPASIFGPGRWACTNVDPPIRDRAQMHFNETLHLGLCKDAFNGGLNRTSDAPYPVGVDPTWHGTRTELQYLNSVKMKLSILLGALLATLIAPADKDLMSGIPLKGRCVALTEFLGMFVGCLLVCAQYEGTWAYVKWVDVGV